MAEFVQNIGKVVFISGEPKRPSEPPPPATVSPASFCVPDGFAVDPSELALLEEMQRMAERDGIHLIEALMHHSPKLDL